MKQYPSRAFIGVKRMGELDTKRFHEITKRKFHGKDADIKAAQLCSIWEHHLMDPNWHPFKDVTRENSSKVMHYNILIVVFHFFVPLNQNTWNLIISYVLVGNHH